MTVAYWEKNYTRRVWLSQVLYGLIFLFCYFDYSTGSKFWLIPMVVLGISILLRLMHLFFSKRVFSSDNFGISIYRAIRFTPAVIEWGDLRELDLSSSKSVAIFKYQQENQEKVIGFSKRKISIDDTAKLISLVTHHCPSAMIKFSN